MNIDPRRVIFILYPMSTDLCTVKTFSYNGEKYGISCKIRYDVEIPLPEYADEDELFGHLVSQQRLPLAFHDEVRSNFRKFVVSETQKFRDDSVEKDLCNVLNNGAWNALPIVDGYSREPSCYPPSGTDESLLSFEEIFKLVMKNSTVNQLSQVVQVEQEMSSKMLSIVRARDFELERLTKACENAISEKSPNDDSDDHLSRQSQNLATLNEKLRQVSTTYCHQIEALQSSQRHAYREFIQKLYKQEEDEDASTGLCSAPLNKRFSALSRIFQDRNRQTNFFMKKSVSCDSQMKQLKLKTSRRDECFTIYIGTQMKSMHNARILVCNRLSDLCQSTASAADGTVDGAESLTLNCAEVGGSTSDVEQLFNSHRLQMLMSLYRRELTGVVLIVGRDPLYHIRNRTHFARLCEQSAELHFDSLEEQLKQVDLQVIRANQLRPFCRRETDDSPTSCAPVRQEYDDNFLQPGDVYMTCHSNLSSAQVVFHLVTDTSLETADISSRHPCITGLRNIIKMASRCAVKNITIPLLLVESMNETMTVSWCVARAELVFKCLKGFLMEVSSTSANGVAAAAGAGSTVLFNSGATTHYNINFALPHKISDQLFGQIVDLFSSIFHLVPSFSA